MSGLGAAYVLSRSGHDVHVFERDSRLGGHVNTIVHDGLALDTGFIVSNARNYPLLTRLFTELGVTWAYRDGTEWLVAHYLFAKPTR